MIYEMRVYRCVPGRLPALLKRFEMITLGLWERHGIRQSQLGFYLQDEARLGALTLLGGVRRDRYRSEDVERMSYMGSPSDSSTRIAQRLESR